MLCSQEQFWVSYWLSKARVKKFQEGILQYWEDKSDGTDGVPILKRVLDEPVPVEDVLKYDMDVSAADIPLRKSEDFMSGSILLCAEFWKNTILKAHPKRKQLSRWFEGGVRIEFLNDHTKDSYEGKEFEGFYPEARQFENNVPNEWKHWVSKELQKNLDKGAMIEWDEELFCTPSPDIVLPLMVEPNKPRLC